MSRVDERIRDEVGRLDRQVDASGVLERVAARKSRRRNTRRVQFAGLALAVVSGTVLGVYGLTQLIGPAGDLTPAESPDASVPAPVDTMPPQTPAEFCARNRLAVDMNADGRMDWVEGWAMAPDCDLPEVGDEYWVHVDISTGPLTGYGYTDPVPGCEAPLACRVLAAPDIDGDGRLELAIRLVSGSTTNLVGIYRFDEEAKAPLAPALLPVEIASPGDPWHEEFGLDPGPALFPLGGSLTTHQHEVGCDAGGTFRARTILHTETETLVHVTTLRIESGALVVEGVDETSFPPGAVFNIQRLAWEWCPAGD